MAASSTKGVKICLVKDGATGTALTVTAVTKAKPAVLTVGAAAATMKTGDVVTLGASATGLSEIDGKTWVVGATTATTIELLGSDTTGSTGTFADGSATTGYKDADMVCLCLSSLTFNPEEAQTISVATFCDPSASIPGAVAGAGTMDFGGYVDVTSNDYLELYKAIQQTSAKTYQVRIFLPNSQGYIVFPATLATLNWDIPLEGAIAYSGTFALGSKPRHLF